MTQEELVLKIRVMPIDGVLNVDEDLLLDELFDRAIGRVRSRNSGFSCYHNDRTVENNNDGSLSITVHLTEVELQNVSEKALLAAMEDALEFDVSFVETGTVTSGDFK